MKKKYDLRNSQGEIIGTAEWFLCDAFRLYWVYLRNGIRIVRSIKEEK